MNPHRPPRGWTNEAETPRQSIPRRWLRFGILVVGAMLIPLVLVSVYATALDMGMPWFAAVGMAILPGFATVAFVIIAFATSEG